MSRRIQCLECDQKYPDRSGALSHHLKTGHNSFYEEPAEDIRAWEDETSEGQTRNQGEQR